MTLTVFQLQRSLKSFQLQKIFPSPGRPSSFTGPSSPPESGTMAVEQYAISVVSSIVVVVVVFFFHCFKSLTKEMVFGTEVRSKFLFKGLTTALLSLQQLADMCSCSAVELHQLLDLAVVHRFPVEPHLNSFWTTILQWNGQLHALKFFQELGCGSLDPLRL